MLLISCDTLPASITSPLNLPPNPMPATQPHAMNPQILTECIAAHFSIVSHSALSSDRVCLLCAWLCFASSDLCVGNIIVHLEPIMFFQWITKWQTRENHYQLIHLRHSLCIYANKPRVKNNFDCLRESSALFYNCLFESRLEKNEEVLFSWLQNNQDFFFGCGNYLYNKCSTYIKVHIAPNFFIPIISYRVRGEAIYALIIKSLYCSDYFSKNNLEQYIYLNVLD